MKRTYCNLILRILSSTLLIFITGSNSFSQLTGYVLDSDSKKPIPYANIWIGNLNVGTTSDTKGFFSFSEDLSGKTLIISALGYSSDSLIIQSSQINVYLKPRRYIIPEVAVSSPRGQNKQVITSFKRSKIDNFYGTGSPTIYARRIKLDDIQTTTPFIETIKIITYSKIDCIINLRILSVSETGEPGEDLLEQNRIVPVKEGLRRVTTITFTGLQKVMIPSEGVFIAFEFLIVPENIYIYKTLNNLDNNTKLRNYPGNDKSKAKIKTYMPLLGAIESEKADNAWTFHGGKWHQDFTDRMDLTFTSKYRTIAMEVIVSN